MFININTLAFAYLFANTHPNGIGKDTGYSGEGVITSAVPIDELHAKIASLIELEMLSLPHHQGKNKTNPLEKGQLELNVPLDQIRDVATQCGFDIDLYLSAG